MGEVLPESPFADEWLCDWLCECEVPLRSKLLQFRVGGPIVEVEEAEVGVMSMASRGGASVELDEGRMGIDLWRFGLCGSGAKGLRRASATEAMARGECEAGARPRW